MKLRALLFQENENHCFESKMPYAVDSINYKAEDLDSREDAIASADTPPKSACRHSALVDVALTSSRPIIIAA